jgi:predicted esterase
VPASLSQTSFARAIALSLALMSGASRTVFAQSQRPGSTQASAGRLAAGRGARPAGRPTRPGLEGVHAPERAGDPERLDLPGMAGAYFYRPSARGRQRVLVYLHARGANPRESCRKWHESTPRFGWLLCPIGPHTHERGGATRQWRNDAGYARRESIAGIERLTELFRGRVRRHDNVVMGFSEGAYVGMNVGLQEPTTFPRWLIIAPNDGYIDGEAARIRRLAESSSRVYLITGRHDEIYPDAVRAETRLVRALGRRRVKHRIMDRAGHELPPEFVPVTRRALLWLTAG